MLSMLLKKVSDAPQDSVFLAGVLALMIGMLSTLYWVCEAQTQRALDRRAQVEAQRLAVRDCIAAVPQPSYALCQREVALRFDPLGTELKTDDALLVKRRASRVTMLVPVVYTAQSGR